LGDNRKILLLKTLNWIVGHNPSRKQAERSPYVKLVINFPDYRAARSSIRVRRHCWNRSRNRKDFVRDFSGFVFRFPRIWQESGVNTEPSFSQIKIRNCRRLPFATQWATPVEQKRGQQQRKRSRMKLKLTYQVAAFAVSIILAGCAKNDQTAAERTAPPTENPVTASDVKREVKEAADTTKSYLDKNKDQFIASVDAQLKTLDAKINDLGQKAEGLKDDTKVEADKVLDGLREKRGELTQKLDELKKSSAQSWQEIKSGFSAAMTDFEKALEEAKNKIRKNS